MACSGSGLDIVSFALGTYGQYDIEKPVSRPSKRKCLTAVFSTRRLTSIPDLHRRVGRVKVHHGQSNIVAGQTIGRRVQEARTDQG